MLTIHRPKPVLALKEDPLGHYLDLMEEANAMEGRESRRKEREVGGARRGGGSQAGDTPFPSLLDLMALMR
ncbi:hypothetical protein E2C01_062320 [Portunus trituberculatus]|uniref:Uncharacterized protein n=1 Tax=Portunus trituberculatus TaxID=210409 RepID=A0A5B7HET5_PORTR|nr:hypothetical protein [Portunus trituberculatus]